MWLLLTLLACGPPSTTGSRGVVGQLFDPIGRPFAGLELHTTLESAETDDEGRFALRWSPEARHVDMRWHEMGFRRTYLPQDEGQELRIVLHRMRHTSMSCGYPNPCAAVLRWQVEPGLSALSTAPCDPDKPPVDLTVLKDLDPTSATCAAPEGEPVESHLRVSEGTVWVSPPPQPIRVHLRAEAGDLPEGCTVKVGSTLATPDEQGWWSATTSGVVTVSALCQGRPAAPAVARAGAEAELVWSSVGPKVDEPRAPETSELVLVSESAPSWTVRIPAGEDGRFLLPPLVAGTYRMAFGDGALLVTARRPFVRDSGTIYILGRVGELRLEEDLLDGSIPVEIQ